MFRLPFQITRAVSLFRPAILKNLNTVGISEQISSKIQNRCISNFSTLKTFNIQQYQTQDSMCKYVNNISIPINDLKCFLPRKPVQLFGMEKVKSELDIRSFHDLTNSFNDNKIIPTCVPQRIYLSKQCTPIEKKRKKGTLICIINPSKKHAKQIMKKRKKKRSLFKKRPIPGCPELEENDRIICICKKMELPRTTCRLIKKKKKKKTILACCKEQPPKEEPYTVECKPVYPVECKPAHPVECKPPPRKKKRKKRSDSCCKAESSRRHPCKSSKSSSCKTSPDCKLPSYQEIMEIVRAYFRARPGCPEPHEWRQKLLEEKARKAAEAAGYELCCCKPKCCPPKKKKKKSDFMVQFEKAVACIKSNLKPSVKCPPPSCQQNEFKKCKPTKCSRCGTKLRD